MAGFIRRIILALGARAATIPVTAIAVAITTAICVSYAGVSTFGYVSLLGTLFLLIPFSDLGLGAAMINAISVRGTDAHHDLRARDAFRRSFLALCWVGLGLIGIAGSLSIAGLWSVILNTPQEIAGQTEAAAFLVFVAVGVAVPLGLGQRLLVGQDKTHIAALIAAGGPLTALLVTWALTIVKAPGMFLAIATPVGILIAAAASTSLALIDLRWTPRRLLEARLDSQADRVPLWSTAVPMLVVMMGAPIALQSHRLILAHYGSAVELAEYSVGAQFYAPALSVVTTGALALWPQFARDRANQLAGWRASLVIMTLFGALGGLCLAVCLNPLASFITDGSITIPVALAVSFAALLLVMSAHQPSAMLLTTSRALRFQAYCMVVFAALAIPASILLVPVLGAAGPVLGTALAVIVTSLIPCIIYARRVILRA